MHDSMSASGAGFLPTWFQREPEGRALQRIWNVFGVESDHMDCSQHLLPMEKENRLFSDRLPCDILVPSISRSDRNAWVDQQIGGYKC